ncbi:MAG: EpsG family protein [Sphingomicrobium sp.]
MLVYWLLFLYFAAGAARERPRPAAAARTDIPFLVGCILMTLMIGLRYHVGADWIPYEEIFDEARRETLGSLPTIADPGYYLVNIAVQRVGGELWMVNLVCGAIFVRGLMRFARAQERPWLAMVVAMPYLVIVVAMGYTRQGVSIGLIMAGLASYLGKGSVLRFAAYVALAATFHKTAVVALPLVALANDRGRIVGLLVAVSITYLFYQYFLSASVGRLVTNYIDARYAAEGAGIRVAMSVLPAALFFLRSRELGFSERERRLWRNLSFAAVGFLVLLIVVRSSAAIDRLALYTIPLQVAVLSRPRSMFTTAGFGTFLIIAYAAAVQFTWLTFAHHARFWVPYHFWPFGG